MMKKSFKSTYILLSISFLLLLVGCEDPRRTAQADDAYAISMTTLSTTLPDSGSEYTYTGPYYTLEDFAQFTMGESSIVDVADALQEKYGYADNWLLTIPMGIAVEYPLDNGQFVRLVYNLGEGPEAMTMREMTLVDASEAEFYESFYSSKERDGATITVNGKRVFVDDINSVIELTLQNTCYYHENWEEGRLYDKTLEYRLFYDAQSKNEGQPMIYMIITNVEHRLSTEESPLLYIFGIDMTEKGLRSEISVVGQVSSLEDTGEYLQDDAVDLGDFSVDTNGVEVPRHQPRSKKWRSRVEAALQMYMENASGNLQPGSYNIYLQGFIEWDEEANIVFIHEDGQIYAGRYCDVHDIAEGQPANVQGVEPVTDLDADYLSYIEKLKEDAIFTTTYTPETA